MALNMLAEENTHTQAYDRQVQIFKLLTHPARLAILETLREGEQCVCHLEAALGYRQAYLSQQLAVLRQAGIIQDRRDGWNIFYRVAQPEVYLVLDAANEMADFSPLPAGRLETVMRCPCPKCAAKRELLKTG